MPLVAVLIVKLERAFGGRDKKQEACQLVNSSGIPPVCPCTTRSTLKWLHHTGLPCARPYHPRGLTYFFVRSATVALSASPSSSPVRSTSAGWRGALVEPGGGGCSSSDKPWPWLSRPVPGASRSQDLRKKRLQDERLEVTTHLTPLAAIVTLRGIVNMWRWP
jgi:hypothetical protein